MTRRFLYDLDNSSQPLVRRCHPPTWGRSGRKRTSCHYQYSETLDRLRDDYYYFSPEVAGDADADRPKSDGAYDDLIQSLDKILKDANFEELPREDVAYAHRKRTVPIEVKAEHDDFREVRFYKRGWHAERFGVTEWLGLRRRKVEIEVFDDIVLVVAMKTQPRLARAANISLPEQVAGGKCIAGVVLHPLLYRSTGQAPRSRQANIAFQPILRHLI
jgi:hypothetical protein